MSKSKAKTLTRILLVMGIVFGLIAKFLSEGQLKITLHNISLGIILGSFLFFLMTFIMPRWFPDEQGNDMKKF